MAGAQFLRMQKLTGKGIVGVAARHNHREILAELGGTPGCAIDPSRTPMNKVLAGAANAAGVVGEAQALMGAAGIRTLRKDAVRALEIVISLPNESAIDQDAFFSDAVRWAGATIGAPILSAIVHRDEPAPHAHILILPLIEGRMVGSDLMGNRSKLQALQADFQLKVARRYGLARQPAPARLSASQRREAIDLAFAALEANSGLQTSLLRVLLEPHRGNPEPLLLALGITLPKAKKKAKDTFVGIMTRPAPEKKEPYRVRAFKAYRVCRTFRPAE
ncbi:plasmid recombination protein [Pseudoduganella sp. UC29_106]|uniref:plasmid recombination protein n=1 Tax=Pseudoduganella sp. UC29_106 TaxID=3374553 RepID=UPI00375681E0